jgi:hypothetical protein
VYLHSQSEEEIKKFDIDGGDYFEVGYSEYFQNYSYFSHSNGSKKSGIKYHCKNQADYNFLFN